jgi:uncharacterized protein YciI
MYILIVNYTQPAAVVEPHIPAHGMWVKKYADAGTFLFAGPKKSGLGGVIAAKCLEKAQLLQILSEDSYVQADVADYQIIDFDCRLAQAGLELLRIE